MKPSLITKILSYVTDIHLESLQSDQNEQLDVFLSQGRYQLCTKNAIYSYADKYDNFKECFDLIQPSKPAIKNVLILGFGLGSIPYMLEKKFHKVYAYTGVELDESVIYLASKYVLNELNSEIQMIHADAQIYVNQCFETFDMICIDIFIDDKIPEIFLKFDFLETVQSLLNPGGLLIFNHLSFFKSDKEKASTYYHDVFSKVFPNSYALQVSKNMMLINDISWIKTTKISSDLSSTRSL